MCHVSHVTCHVSRVTCHMSKNIFLHFHYKKKKNKNKKNYTTKNIGKSAEAYRWRVCYQRGLPRLVLESFKELFLKPYFRRTKVPQNVWILVILPHFSWKMSKPKEKKFLKCLEFDSPPPSELLPN